jgi:hypothetical protein
MPNNKFVIQFKKSTFWYTAELYDCIDTDKHEPLDWGTGLSEQDAIKALRKKRTEKRIQRLTQPNAADIVDVQCANI